MSSGYLENNLPSLSKKELVILELLTSQGELYGLEMVRASEGKLRRGSIYVLLSRMAEKGYVDSKEVPREYPEIGIPRRQFWATRKGVRMYEATVKAAEVFRAELSLEGAE